MVRPGEYLEPLMLLAGSLLVAGLDVLVFMVLLGGSISAIGCFAFGSALGGVGWLIEVWRRRREALAQLEAWERARLQQEYIEEYAERYR